MNDVAFRNVLIAAEAALHRGIEKTLANIEGFTRGAAWKIL
jgi:hypothetical protein